MSVGRYSQLAVSLKSQGNWRKKEVKYFLDSPSANLVLPVLGDNCGSLVKGGLKMLWRH